MDFDNKELCQNLGELVMMKVAGELDAEQYEACTEYMLKEAGWFDNAVNYLRNVDYAGLVNKVRGYANQGFDLAETGAERLHKLTSNAKGTLADVKDMGNMVGETLEAVGAKPKASGLTLGKALGVGGAAGVGTFGLANLLSAAGKTNAYDPYEY